MTTAPTPLAPCDAPDTTRRHPRSLAEAFPDCRAACIERPARTHAIDRYTNAAALVALVLLALVLTLEKL